MSRLRSATTAVILLVLAPTGRTAAEPTTAANLEDSLCLMIEAAARAHDLPLEFFARIIWQESRFRPDAVGPVTRSGARAVGIAQFMPGTAAERGLLDPFDPVQALPKAAEYLRDLLIRFGNLGLAAAAYNAGPQRVRDWLAGSRTLPGETRNYVLAVTGAPADAWARGDPRAPATTLPPDCAQITTLLARGPNPFVRKLEERIGQSAASAWGVQLSAGFSRERALETYSSLAQKYTQLLEGRDPTLISSVFRSRGTQTFYQVRIGTVTRGEADSLCGRIRRAGGACLVLRNRGTS